MPRRDPFREIEELFDRMSREFEDLGGGLGGGIGVGTDVGGGIQVDVAEDDEAVTVTADLPGFDREDIDVTVEDDVLTIAAEHEEETEEAGEGEEGEEETYHRRERRRRSASRRLRLPTAVEEEEATAEYANGVLTVTLPKVEPEDTEGHSIDVE